MHARNPHMAGDCSCRVQTECAHPRCFLLRVCGRHGCLAACPLLLAPHEPEGEVRFCNPAGRGALQGLSWLLVPTDSWHPQPSLQLPLQLRGLRKEPSKAPCMSAAALGHQAYMNKCISNCLHAVDCHADITSRPLKKDKR